MLKSTDLILRLWWSTETSRPSYLYAALVGLARRRRGQHSVPIHSLFSYLFTVALPGMGHSGTCPPLEFDARSIFLATRSVLWPKICRKCDSGRGSAPDLAGGGAHDAPPDPLVGCGAETPLHTPPHSVPRCSRLRRLDRCAPPDTKSWRRHCLFISPKDSTIKSNQIRL